VGVLIEVPLMLMLVKICLKTTHWFKTAEIGVAAEQQTTG
jgi:ACR3 family arsenite transporter